MEELKCQLDQISEHAEEYIVWSQKVQEVLNMKSSKPGACVCMCVHVCVHVCTRVHPCIHMCNNFITQGQIINVVYAFYCYY